MTAERYGEIWTLSYPSRNWISLIFGWRCTYVHTFKHKMRRKAIICRCLWFLQFRQIFEHYFIISQLWTLWCGRSMHIDSLKRMTLQYSSSLSMRIILSCISFSIIYYDYKIYVLYFLSIICSPTINAPMFWHYDILGKPFITSRLIYFFYTSSNYRYY